MGSGYVIEHCVSAFSNRCKEKAYKVYVSDTLKCINETLANTYGGTCISARYSEIIGDVIEDERTADEIVEDIIEKAGLKVA